MDRNFLRLLEDFQKFKSIDSTVLWELQEAATKINLNHLNALHAQRIEQWQRYEELSRAFSSIDTQRIQNQAMGVIERLESIDKRFFANAQRSIELAQRNWRNIDYVFNSPAFIAITDVFTRVQHQHKSFLIDIAEKVREIAVEIDEGVQEQTLTQLKDSLIEKARQLPKGTVSFEGMVQILISLITLFLAFLSYLGDNDAAEQAHRDMQALTHRVEQLPDEIIPKLATLLQVQTDTSWYVVNRQASMFSKSTVKSSIIGVLYPNQRVQLIQRKHKWIYVQYFDYLDCIPRNGWVLKKYLKLISQ